MADPTDTTAAAGGARADLGPTKYEIGRKLHVIVTHARTWEEVAERAAALFAPPPGAPALEEMAEARLASALFDELEKRTDHIVTMRSCREIAAAILARLARTENAAPAPETTKNDGAEQAAEIERLAAALDRETRHAARLLQFVGFVRVWIHRQTPPNATNSITDEMRLDAIRHHPMLNDTDACLAGLTEDAMERRLAAAEADAARAREVLRAIEWESSGVDPIYGDLAAACPNCGQIKPEGHAPNCALAAALTTERPDGRG